MSHLPICYLDSLMLTSAGSARPASISMTLMMPEGTGQAGCERHWGAALERVGTVAPPGELPVRIDILELLAQLADRLAVALDGQMNGADRR